MKLHPPPPTATIERYRSLAMVSVFRVPRSVEVTVIPEDREVGPVVATAVISKLIDEILISDMLASELKIAIEDPARGLWRFSDEPLDKLRRGPSQIP